MISSEHISIFHMWKFYICKPYFHTLAIKSKRPLNRLGFMELGLVTSLSDLLTHFGSLAALPTNRKQEFFIGKVKPTEPSPNKAKLDIHTKHGFV